MVLTTGRAAIPGEEIDHLARCAIAVKKVSGLPIQAQFLPPPGLDGLDRLKEAGVDSVGIHVESFDFDVLSKVAPCKAKIGQAEYVRTWKKAVELFGSNQVSSFLIVGLGESEKSIIMGAEFLADLGVYPFIVPFRPIPGSMMEAVRPPDPQKMSRIYEAVAEPLKRKGLTLARQKAGCVRCGACSAMGFFEQSMDPLICHPVRNQEELEKAYHIRNQIFVQEQGLFEKSDADQNDDKSIHLVAELEDQIIGTVRVFPNENNGHWIGGRLAIKREHRHSGAGELLVREAVGYVKRQDCRRFTAHIQVENVPFFLRLGWKALGPVFEYRGVIHQLMEADLRDNNVDFPVDAG